jgi:hypothetical protein
MDKLPDAAERQLRQLAADIVDLKTGGVFAALHLLITDQYRILLDKGLISLEEIERRMAMLDAMAAGMKEGAPETADQITQATMFLRHGLGIKGPGARQ